MNKRQLTLPHLVKTYKQWPAETDSPGATSHYGYNWRKVSPVSPWILVNPFGDTIREEDYIAEYEDNVRMSDLFDLTEPKYPITVPSDIQLTFTPAQYKALCVALRQHDGMKFKIEQAICAARKLSFEIGL